MCGCDFAKASARGLRHEWGNKFLSGANKLSAFSRWRTLIGKVQPTDDSQLLRQYSENNADEAFAALVQRHINLVYSVALRSVGQPQDAKEITQAVFIILAKKAASLCHHKALSSWLFQTARLTANNFVRSEMRRQHREQEAYMQSILDESGNDVWPKIAPLLDSAVANLREKDRQAILLRFYQGKNLREIGDALQIKEDAAEKRVSRALEKLRKVFTKRGVNSTTAILAGTISANSIQVAPVGLAKTISVVAIAKGATASASTLTLIKGTLKIMAWTKMKTTIMAGAVILLAATTSTVVIKAVKSPKLETRTFRVDARVFMANLQKVTESSANDSTAKIVANYFATKGLDLRPPKSIFFNETNGLLFAHATLSDMNTIEKIVSQLNYAPPQIHWKVYFMKVPEDEIQTIIDTGTVLNSTGKNSVEIISDAKLRLLFQKLYQSHSETLAEPEVVTTIGHQARMQAGDSIVNLIPTLFADNYTIKMKVIVNAPETLTANANVWDGQTLALGSQRSDGKNRLTVFVTTRLVDAAGNPIHSEDELPFAQNAIPPQ